MPEGYPSSPDNFDQAPLLRPSLPEELPPYEPPQITDGGSMIDFARGSSHGGGDSNGQGMYFRGELNGEPPAAEPSHGQ